MGKKISISSLLPLHLRVIVPALTAMFAISTTFTLYNFSLFQHVLDREWSNSFVTLVFNANLSFCIFGFAGLLILPSLALRKTIMCYLTLLLGIGGIFLFQNTAFPIAWLLFFTFGGGISVFWHQNVRMTLIQQARKDEYARIFSLYMISHVSGNVFGGLLFQILENDLHVLSAILMCYGICIVSLLFYPKPQKHFKPMQQCITWCQFTAFIRHNPILWLVSLSAGFMGETFFNFYVPYLSQHGLTTAFVLSTLLVFQVSGILFKYPTATLMDKLGLFQTTQYIMLLAVVLNVIQTLYSNTTAIFVVCMAVLLGASLNALTIVGDTIVMKAAPQEQHHTAAAFSMLIYFLGGLLGNTIVGPTMDYLLPSSLPIITIIFIGLMWLGLHSSQYQHT